jgi:hypothetical protein
MASLERHPRSGTTRRCGIARSSWPALLSSLLAPAPPSTTTRAQALWLLGAARARHAVREIACVRRASACSAGCTPFYRPASCGSPSSIGHALPAQPPLGASSARACPFFLVLPWIVLAEIQTGASPADGRGRMGPAAVRPTPSRTLNEWTRLDWCLGSIPVGGRARLRHAGSSSPTRSRCACLHAPPAKRFTPRTPAQAPAPSSGSPP